MYAHQDIVSYSSRIKNKLHSLARLLRPFFLCRPWRPNEGSLHCSSQTAKPPGCRGWTVGKWWQNVGIGSSKTIQKHWSWRSSIFSKLNDHAQNRKFSPKLEQLHVLFECHHMLSQIFQQWVELLALPGINISHQTGSWANHGKSSTHKCRLGRDMLVSRKVTT